MTANELKVTCQTPTPGKKPTQIPKWKYDLLRDAILKVLPTSGEGLLFTELPDKVASILDPQDLAKLGSVGWYTTTVKLDMEVRGEIERVPKVIPQRLLRKK
jgi:hypothetical protein